MATKKALRLTDVELISQIDELKADSSYHWHMMRRAGLAKKYLVNRYNIRRLIEGLADKKFKKYRKKLSEALAENESIANSEAETGKQYNERSAEYSDVTERIKEIAEMMDAKVKGFASASKKVRADVERRINGLTEVEAISEKVDLAKAA